MYLIILLIVFGFLFYVSVTFRLIVKNPHLVAAYGFTDILQWFRFKLYNVAPMGKIKAYCADFGGGKTLSAVTEVVDFYNRYHNRKFFDVKSRKWITQKVLVVSNVDFTQIPFQRLTGLSQLVDLQKYNRKLDDDNGTRTCCIFLIDEASSQLNSRNFSKNFNPAVIGALVTCRHYNTSLIYTSQVFTHVDKLLRDDTMLVVQCRKLWRFMIHSVYDAHVLEYASDPTIIQPLYRTGFFIRNRHFAAYDTLALVDNLSHSATSGDMLSESEVLQNRQQLLSDESLPLSSKGRKRFRSRRKV